MQNRSPFACLLAALTLAACDEADNSDQGSVNAAGRQIFQQRCSACHVATAEQNRVGPHLVELFGRPAGTVPDFGYSAAMLNAELTWDADTLAEYLQAPREYLPGNRMAFVGLAREADIEALLNYLRVVTQAPQD
ncbi:MAG: cytochrome c family protein [Pseudomonadota bacterium]